MLILIYVDFILVFTFNIYSRTSCGNFNGKSTHIHNRINSPNQFFVYTYVFVIFYLKTFLHKIIHFLLVTYTCNIFKHNYIILNIFLFKLKKKQIMEQ